MILRNKRASLEVAKESTIDFDADKLCYEITDRAPDPEKRYARKEEGRILNRAIQRLRPTLREVVEIQRLQEYSIRETAETAGIFSNCRKGAAVPRQGRAAQVAYP